MNKKITRMINRNYGTGTLWDGKARPSPEKDADICWKFCREIFAFYDKNLPDKPHDNLKRIRRNEMTIPCIVLFRFGRHFWHSGVMWPDGLHFLHANFEPPARNQEKKSARYVIRQERITAWPWNILLEGFYVNVQ